MVFFLLGLFFFSSLGMFIYPIYGIYDNALVWPIVLVIGIVFNIIGCYRASDFTAQNGMRRPTQVEGHDPHSAPRATHPVPSSLQSAIFLIPLFLGIYAIHFPYSLALYVLIGGIILGLILRRRHLRPIYSGILLSGLIMSFQTILVIPYFKLAARYHEAGMFGVFFYWILKGLGISCAYSQDTIFVQTTMANMALVTSWERLGLFFLITFFIGALVLFFCMNLGGRFPIRLQTSVQIQPDVSKGTHNLWALKPIAIFSLILISYAIIRYIFLSVIYIEIVKVEIFWEPIIVACSFLPLPFLLWRFIPVDNGMKTYILSDNTQSSTHHLLPVLYAGIAMFFFSSSLITYFWFHDPGRMKQGRILIDEFHSNWEWTDKGFNTEWYGIQSVYNYYCFADYLNHFYSVKRLRKEATKAQLDKCDVFIIKTPTSPFIEGEIEAIVNFVKEGGGLFLIGDHTNVFGTTLNINPLARRFGIVFNYDATYDLRTNDLHLHEHNRLFRHPVVKDMPYFLFATSCSLSAPFFAEDVMIASNLKTIYLDYSRGGYFPDKNKELNYTFGLFLQSVAKKYGRGRVLVFSDSTCFSNFYMHIPGKPEYAMGGINWLNRSNLYDIPVKIISLIVLSLSVGFTAYFFQKIGKKSDQGGGARAFLVKVLLFAALLGASSGVLWVNCLTNKHYSPPEAHTRMIKIGFETQYCDFQIPSRQLLHNPFIDYHTFYVWSQRLGYFPTLFSLKDSLAHLDMVVLVNPQKYLSGQEIKKIESYVTGGGRLLVIDNPVGKRSVANQIIERFGMKVRHEQYQKDVEVYEGDIKVGTLESFSPIEGGQALLTSKDGKAIISIERSGNGLIAVIASSSSFTNKEMGETEDIPSEHQSFLYKLEFWIFSSMINKEFASFINFTIEDTLRM